MKNPLARVLYRVKVSRVSKSLWVANCRACPGNYYGSQSACTGWAAAHKSRHLR